jgi:hypothetical protein
MSDPPTVYRAASNEDLYKELHEGTPVVRRSVVPVELDLIDLAMRMELVVGYNPTVTNAVNEVERWLRAAGIEGTR